MKDMVDLQSDLYDLTMKDLEGIKLRVAESKGAFERLDEGKKTYLAGLKMKKEGSDANRSTEAMATEEWHNYLRAMNGARDEYLKDKAEEDTVVTKIKVLITLISSMKIT